MSLNTLLMIASSFTIALLLIAIYFNARGKKELIYEEDYRSIENVLEGVKLYMVEIVKEDYTMSYSDEEFNKLYKRQARINDSLKKCVYGIDSAKSTVIDLIRDFIDENVPDENVSKMTGLDDESEPSDHVMFEILMYRYKKRYGKRALAEWMAKYNFARERQATDSDREQDKAYYITVDDLQQSYMEEGIKLSLDEQRDILAILVYQLYKGFGIVDTLREMDINGFNMGTSGSILSVYNNPKAAKYRANNAVWLYFDGKYIHLRFMNYGGEDELKRMIQLLIRYNNPGALTAKRGYLVTTMYDKSRVLALRPPASEYWAIFVRKFTLNDVSPEKLIIKSFVKNGELCIKLIELMIRGNITTAVTGRQGSGKTTLLSSIIRFIDPKYNIRVLELSPELYLRELYNTRNILSVQETNTVTAVELQNALKKSDAAITIVGEVASAAIAARMIELGMVASIATFFTHHANTPKDLVLSLRNNLVDAGGFGNENTAEKQVTDVVKGDIHMDYTASGKRYIAKISEIVPLESNVPYEEYDPNDPVNSMNRITRDYYGRQTDRISFTWRTIMYYDEPTDTYHPQDRFTPNLENSMIASLDSEIRAEFKKFILTYWGRRPEGDQYKENLFSSEEEYAEIMGDSVNIRLTKIKDDTNGALDEKATMDDFIQDSVNAQLADEFNIGLFET